MEGKFHTQVINCSLENPTVGLKKGGPNWFSLLYHLADRVLKRFRIYRALDYHELAELPLCLRATGFLREPYVQLSARQRKCAFIEVHADISRLL
jgi:hypothetical protein